MERILFINFIKTIVNFRLIPADFDGLNMLRQMYRLSEYSSHVDVYTASKEPDTKERDAIEFLMGRGDDVQFKNFQEF